ncbi:MAG: thiamine pyrophosphate-binding protein [Planctomycetota bacterium]
MIGARAICKYLESRGVGAVFGVAGTQNVELFEALRNSTIRTVAAPHELAAGFMANGYFHATGRPGVLITIPGPGFTYSIPALAEARLDSLAIVHLLGRPTELDTPRYQLQDIPQREMASSLVKRFIQVASRADLIHSIDAAFALACEGEPGPVIVEIPRSFLTAEATDVAFAAPAAAKCNESDFAKIRAALGAAKRIAIYAGQGARGASKELAEAARYYPCPVFLTTSARGAVPEDSPFSFPIDKIGSRFDKLNSFLASCDLVLGLGVKFTHNGTGGFRLRIPRDKFIHVDASAEVLNANIPARDAFVMDAPELLRRLSSVNAGSAPRAPGFATDELLQLKSELLTPEPPEALEPRFTTMSPPTAARFFDILRNALPRSAAIVTDSGLHQLLARKYYQVLEPRTLIVPADFQSMGFALPAAAGVFVGNNNSATVALMGDGGFAMMGFDMLMLARERIPVKVIVFNDRQLGLIRIKQIQEYGAAHATEITNPNFELFAESIGIDYLQMESGAEARLQTILNAPAPALIEVPLGDPPGVKTIKIKHSARRAAESVLGKSLMDKVKKKLRG